MSVNVILKDRSGTDITYTVNSAISLPLSGGGTQLFYLAAPQALLTDLVDRSITTVAASDIAGIPAVGDYAFANCYSLTSAEIPSSATAIGNYAFSECTSLTSVTIPDSVTSIGDHAFSFCTSLASVTIPNTMEYIYPGAFSQCYALLSLIFPASLQGTAKTGEWELTDMFFLCTSIQSIDLPDIDMLLNNTFSGNTALRSLIIRCSTPPTPMNEDLNAQGKSKSIAALVGSPTIYVPQSAVSTYQTDQYWSEVASQIQAIT